MVALSSQGKLNVGDEQDALEELALTQLLRFNAAVSGIITGILAGSTVFVATIWLVIKGGPVVGPHLSLLGQFFIGYRVTVGGSLIGAAYGFACGFAIGYFVAWMYNYLIDLKGGKRLGGGAG